MVRILWTLFVASVITVSCLWVSRLRHARRDASFKTPPPASAEDVSEPLPSPRRIEDQPSSPLRVLPSEGEPENAGRETGVPSGETTDDAPRPSPEEFLEGLLAAIQAGDLERVSRHLSPGMARLFRGLLPLVVRQKAGQESEELDRILSEAAFELEELADGAFRVRVEGLGPFPEEIYLVPRDGSWELATESDLPGPLADFRAALNRLRLLALCQYTFLNEELGARPRYAETTSELAKGLNRNPAYGEILDVDFVRAVDYGRPYGPYVFGRITAPDGGFGYTASPLWYGNGPPETLLIDGAGDVWAKDLEGAPAPSVWPAADLEKQGWEPRGGTWR